MAVGARSGPRTSLVLDRISTRRRLYRPAFPWTHDTPSVVCRGRSLLVPAAAAVPIMRRYTAAGADGPPVIVLMDSAHPERVYDDETRKAGGTNADDLTDLLRDLPVRLVKENTNATWHREYEVVQEQPALIVAHRSCFYDATILGEASRELPFVNLSWG